MVFKQKYRGPVCIVCGRHDRELQQIDNDHNVCRGEHYPQEIRIAIVRAKKLLEQSGDNNE